MDYGTGNLRSVVKAFEFLGSKVQVFQSPDGIGEMDALLIFPGQGTFDQCMESLRKTGFDEKIRDWIEEGKPYFGICLGLQVLFNNSEEGELEGLGIFSGQVKRFPTQKALKIPHMGWNSMGWNLSNKDTLRQGLVDGDQFYFVHSYFVTEVSKKVVCFQTSYGSPFVSGIYSGKCLLLNFIQRKVKRKVYNYIGTFLKKLSRIGSNRFYSHSNIPKMPESADLRLNDQSYPLPILTGTEKEHAIDISQLRKLSKFITHDDGYGNTGSCESSITFIDGDKGIYAIEDMIFPIWPRSPTFWKLAIF